MNQFSSFVVFAEMRTGSNFLEENINNFPDLTCHGEVFNPSFIGYPRNDDLFGFTVKDRESNPKAVLSAIKANTDGLGGFRFFHNHDARILEDVLQDRSCAKIILTRNPIDSFVSWKIAAATGQWKLTNPTHQKTQSVTIDPDEFSEHLAKLQSFQVHLLNSLQRTGQTAFYVAYEDLQDVDVMNGLAAYLGSGHQVEALSKRFKKQNPSPMSEKIDNFEEVEAALARMDQFNLNRTPNFEPRRGAMLNTYIAAPKAPLLFMPINAGPKATINKWLAAMDATSRDQLLRNFTQKDLRVWKRLNKGHRSFTVVRHPVQRAYHSFCQHILHTDKGSFLGIRKMLRRVHNMPLPEETPRAGFTADEMRDAFLVYLQFIQANLSGQTATRIDNAWASQAEIIKGFSDFAAPDMIIREDRLTDGLEYLSTQVGRHFMEPEIETETYWFPLSEIYNDEIESAAQSAYRKDYITFGYKRFDRT